MRAVDGVAAATGAFRALSVTVVDDRGKRVGPTQGAPTLAFSAVPERFDTFDYEGRAPRSDGEIALSEKAAKDAGVQVGDRIRVQGTQKIRPYTVVGITTFGGAGSLGGAAFTVLTLPEVQALAGEPGKLTDIDVQAEAGITQAELKRRVSAQVGQAVLVRTGAEDSAQQSEGPRRASSSSSRSGCSSSASSPCWWAASSSSTRSRSPSPSARASSGCCARSARRAGRCCGRSCSRRC